VTSDADRPADVREVVMDALADETVRPDLAEREHGTWSPIVRTVYPGRWRPVTRSDA
jgi:hypothetical protein